LGRPFLYIANANIYIGSGHIHFNLPAGKVRCQFKTHVNHEQIRKQHNRRRHQAHRQVAQPHHRWEDFPGKIVKYEDRFMEQEENKRAPRWREWQKKLKGWTESPRKRKRRS